MLKRILLLKAWGAYVKGNVVEVDELRAARLIEDGAGFAADGHLPARPDGYQFRAESGPEFVVPAKGGAKA